MSILSTLIQAIQSIIKPDPLPPPVNTPKVASPEPKDVRIPNKVVIPLSKSAGKYEISTQGAADLIAREGLCQTKYKDSVGVWTIGAGATSSEIPDLASWPASRTLSIEEVFKLFTRGLVKYSDAVNKSLKVPVEQHQFDALVSIAYNIGVGGMAKSTFMRRINAKASPLAIREAILMWDKPPEIKGRRKQEADLYQKGIYSNPKMQANLFPVNPKTFAPQYSKGKTINLKEYL